MSINLDPVEVWVNGVGHSNSKATKIEYRRNMAQFLAFIGSTGQAILDDYDRSEERAFKRKYAMILKAWINSLTEYGYAPNSVNSMLGAVQSFFMHNDLPLGFIPSRTIYIMYHNRDITREEVALILKSEKPRGRAFDCMMAQSGLRPDTLCQLRIKNLEPDFSKGTVPCKIDVPQEHTKGKYHGYFTFMGEESIKYLKAYLSTRKNVTPDSYIFTQEGHDDEPVSPKVISGGFGKLLKVLRANKQIEFKVLFDKPSEIRLYNLRKFFKKYANQAGFEFVEFWMGHTMGVVDNYRASDPEFHRQLYAEKAMPFLRIEEATPSETDKTVQRLTQELAESRNKIGHLEEAIGALIELSTIQRGKAKPHPDSMGQLAEKALQAFKKAKSDSQAQ